MRIKKGNVRNVEKQFGLRGNKSMCSLTGVPIMSYNGRTQWDGQFVQSEIFEKKQPQDVLPVVHDKIAPPVVRPINIIYNGSGLPSN